jgi:hypothetical protein
MAWSSTPTHVHTPKFITSVQGKPFFPSFYYQPSVKKKKKKKNIKATRAGPGPIDQHGAQQW